MRFPQVPVEIQDPLRRFLTTLLQALTENTKTVVTTERAVDSVLLVSPNGSVYSVRVDDAGVLYTTLLSSP